MSMACNLPRLAEFSALELHQLTSEAHVEIFKQIESRFF